MTRGRVIARLRRLRDWEAVSVVVMPAIAVYVWPEIDGLAGWLIRVPALVMVSLILAQGTAYWHLKLRSVRTRAPLPTWFCGAFRRSRTAAAAGLLASAVVLIGSHALGKGSTLDFVWGWGLLTFATLEYVNYFHVQLMHDSFADWRYLGRHRRLREAPLRTDLRRICR